MAPKERCRRSAKWRRLSCSRRGAVPKQHVTAFNQIRRGVGVARHVIQHNTPLQSGLLCAFISMQTQKTRAQHNSRLLGRELLNGVLPDVDAIVQ